VIFELAKCAGSLAAIFLSGGIVYAAIIGKGERRWPEAVSYGWGAGIVLLYVAGGILVRIPPLFFRWHLYCLGFLLLPAAVPVAFYFRRHGLPELRLPRIALSPQRIDPWVAAMLVFLVFHALLLLWTNLNRPVFDSDAISPRRWVGLAKTVYRLGGLPSSAQAWNPTFPSLIPLWPNMFTVRWFDSMAAIPWFCFYVLMLLITVRFVRRIAGSLRAGLAYACVLASIPLMWTHVIRPGFSDLIVCYFMAAVLSLLFYSYQFRQRRYFLFSLIFMAGACMSKQEAVGWMILVYAGYGLLYWHVRLRKSVALILGIEGIVIASGLATHLLLADYILGLVAGRFRYLGIVFRGGYDPAAVPLLLERTFTWATFGIYWYLAIGILIYLLIRPGSDFIRLLAAQCALVYLLLLYFLCATGNVRLTIAGTNASRLLLQWVPLGTVLYVVLVSRVLRGQANPDGA
jgi:hypothetical protein